MSRLDYVTIAIVAVCIMAILFLVYKMTNVFNSNKPKDKTEIAADSIETEDDSVYDYEIDNNVDSTGATNGSAATDQTGATKLATPTTPANKSESSASKTPAEDDNNTAGTGEKTTEHTGTAAADTEAKTTFSDGKYMVLAGSFSKRAFADSQVRKLDKMGYDNARVELFDRGKYAVVLVDRFDNMAEAERLVRKLNADGVKSYVKVKS